MDHKELINRDSPRVVHQFNAKGRQFTDQYSSIVIHTEEGFAKDYARTIKYLTKSIFSTYVNPILVDVSSNKRCDDELWVMATILHSGNL